MSSMLYYIGFIGSTLFTTQFRTRHVSDILQWLSCWIGLLWLLLMLLVTNLLSSTSIFIKIRILILGSKLPNLIRICSQLNRQPKKNYHHKLISNLNIIYLISTPIFQNISLISFHKLNNYSLENHLILNYMLDFFLFIRFIFIFSSLLTTSFILNCVIEIWHYLISILWMGTVEVCSCEGFGDTLVFGYCIPRRKEKSLFVFTHLSETFIYLIYNLSALSSLLPFNFLYIIIFN